MKAAIVWEAGKPPVYSDFKDPVAAAGESHIAVTAAALSPVVKARASGAHYSVSGGFPLGVGIDGVGRREDGRRVYFFLPNAPFGSIAELAAVPSSRCVTLPDGLDDVTAAAIATPGMSSWAAFKERARLAAGETVLINGATGISGRLAVQVAKFLGARKVIATGRNAAVLQSLKALGADVTIALTEDREALEEAFKEQFAGGIDVILDYLWGPSAESMLAIAAKTGREMPLRFVQIGTSGGLNITLPGAILRSADIALMGSGLGSVPLPRIVKAIDELLQAAVPGGFTTAAKAVPLAEVGPAWSVAGFVPRIVFTVARGGG